MNCNTCGTHYREFDFAPGQAPDCSASVYLKDGDFYLLAFYGSQHDMRRFALKPGNYELGTICDTCINTLINEGVASLIEDGVW